MNNITVLPQFKKENQNKNERKRTASSLERVSAIKIIKTNAIIWINEKLKKTIPKI